MKMNAMPFESKKTRSGGRALSFYACLEIWSSVIGKIRKVIGGEKLEQGTRCKIQIPKNRLTGRERIVEIPIYNSYGIDDMGSCIDYLLKQKHWTKIRKEQKIEAKEFGLSCSQKKLITHIEENEMEMDLQDITTNVWNDIEERLKLKRKKRYE